ncbi:MAG: tryptophan-rich sensory protein [Chloroflexales bacterium]|nr:tryptophan-rich sensory protein [Chloroflexales bacterium]
MKTRNRILGVLAIGSVIVTPVIGIFGPFNNGNLTGQNTTELFLPAGYAFSIWAVNYVGLILYGLWLLRADSKRANQAAPWLAASALGNLVWIWLAGSVTTVPLTVPVLIVMEMTAWIAYFKLGIDQRDALPQGERLLAIPLQIYLGWLSVATIANSAAVLNVLGWDGWGVSPVDWTLIMLVAGTAVAWEVGRRVNQDNVYRAVFIWAFVAIFVEQQAYPAVAWSALAAAGVVLVMIVGTQPRQHKRLFEAAQ